MVEQANTTTRRGGVWMAMVMATALWMAPGCSDDGETTPNNQQQEGEDLPSPEDSEAPLSDLDALLEGAPD
ncbi:MAG: hypothetical protein AAFS10_24220, partial [Myxococcota bacterium]